MKIHHLFFSHSWAYSDAYDKLKKLLEEKGYFYFNDYSVPKGDPVHVSTDKELSEAIKNKMQSCNVIIVLAGVYATYSEWINKEIKIAKNGFSTPKPILAIEPFGSKNTSLLVKDNADKIVKWNTESIVSAIRELDRDDEKRAG